MNGPKNAAWVEVPLDTYIAAQERVRVGRLDALLARWEFGHLLLQEKQQNGGNQLPHGRMKAIRDAVGLSDAEIRNRLQFATERRTKEEVTNALVTFRSWYEICRRGLGERAGTGPSDSLIGRDLHAGLDEVKRFLAFLDRVEEGPEPDRQIVAELQQVYERLAQRFEPAALEATG